MDVSFNGSDLLKKGPSTPPGGGPMEPPSPPPLASSSQECANSDTTTTDTSRLNDAAPHELRMEAATDGAGDCTSIRSSLSSSR